MSVQLDMERFGAALSDAEAKLLRMQDSQGDWRTPATEGSPLATAAAICALVAAERHVDDDANGQGPGGGWLSGVLMRTELSELIVQSVKWLADRQNEDGGWGDCSQCKSTLPATMLVEAAFHLTGVPARFAGLLERTGAFIDSHGSAAKLVRDYDDDRALATGVLASRAAADLLAWRKVTAIPFEQALWSDARWWVGEVQQPSWQSPTWIALRLARSAIAPSRLPWAGWLRSHRQRRDLDALARLQSRDGSFFASTPTTGFVATCLASAGLADHKVVRFSVEFLLSEVDADGSWPLTPKTDVRQTAAAIGALDGQVARIVNGVDSDERDAAVVRRLNAGRQWLVQRQCSKPDDRTGSPAGGWSWTSVGGVATVEDASAAITALAGGLIKDQAAASDRDAACRAIKFGVNWLTSQQGDAGGWPAVLSGGAGSSAAPESVDATAEAVVAVCDARSTLIGRTRAWQYDAKLDAAIQRGCDYLESTQQASGSWAPAMFGNQHTANECNAVYGTARAVVALAKADRVDGNAVGRGIDWLIAAQHASGGWGPAVFPRQRGNVWAKQTPAETARLCSIEETAVAVEALLAVSQRHPRAVDAALLGLSWIVDAVLDEEDLDATTVARMFGRIWRHDKLLPLCLSVRVLRQAALLLRNQKLPIAAGAR